MKRRFRLVGAVCVAAVAGTALGGDGSAKAVRRAYADRTLYLQHNLPHEDGDASWANLHGTGAFVPVGTAVRLGKVSSDEIVLRVGDETVAIDCDEVRPSLEVVADRLLGTAPPVLDDLSEAERAAVEAARVEPGMSRRAVLLSLGYPPYFIRSIRIDRKMIANTDPEAPELVWVRDDYNVIVVRFDGDTVASVEVSVGD